MIGQIQQWEAGSEDVHLPVAAVAGGPLQESAEAAAGARVSDNRKLILGIREETQGAFISDRANGGVVVVASERVILIKDENVASWSCSEDRDR